MIEKHVTTSISCANFFQAVAEIILLRHFASRKVKPVSVYKFNHNKFFLSVCACMPFVDSTCLVSVLYYHWQDSYVKESVDTSNAWMGGNLQKI